MDMLTQQFLALRRSLNKLLADVSGLQERIGTLNETLKQQTETLQEANASERVLQAELQVTHPIEVLTEPKDKKQIPEWLWFGVDSLTMLFVVAYTIITLFVFCETRKAANAAKNSADTQAKTMRLDERSWMNIVVGKGTMIDNNPLVVPIAVVNTGKTPALDVSGKMVVNLLNNNDDPDLTYRVGHPGYSVDVKALAPNNPQQLQYAALPKYVTDYKFRKPIIVNPTLRKEISDGSLYIVVHARITYNDIFGKAHWLTYCSRSQNVTPGVKTHNAGSDICGDYNNIDRNF
jgi:hypothetical protein